MWKSTGSPPGSTRNRKSGLEKCIPATESHRVTCMACSGPLWTAFAGAGYDQKRASGEGDQAAKSHTHDLETPYRLPQMS
jgi:hypothetical protein